jgi:hypothetical protein
VGLAGKATTWPPRGLAAWEVAAMSLVTEHLERLGCAFEVIPHRQAYTSIDEARALGVDADEVLKTLAGTVASGDHCPRCPPPDLLNAACDTRD